ncbi:hypothetical protein PENTCL1PPCAC_24122, partial [Pristionchus entomophagus]
ENIQLLSAESTAARALLARLNEVLGAVVQSNFGAATRDSLRPLYAGLERLQPALIDTCENLMTSLAELECRGAQGYGREESKEYGSEKKEEGGGDWLIKGIEYGSEKKEDGEEYGSEAKNDEEKEEYGSEGSVDEQEREIGRWRYHHPRRLSSHRRAAARVLPRDDGRSGRAAPLSEVVGMAYRSGHLPLRGRGGGARIGDLSPPQGVLRHAAARALRRSACGA